MNEMKGAAPKVPKTHRDSTHASDMHSRTKKKKGCKHYGIAMEVFIHIGIDIQKLFHCSTAFVSPKWYIFTRQCNKIRAKPPKLPDLRLGLAKLMMDYFCGRVPQGRQNIFSYY